MPSQIPTSRRLRRAASVLVLGVTLGFTPPLVDSAHAARSRGDGVTRACQSISAEIEVLVERIGGHRLPLNHPDKVRLRQLLDAWEDVCARFFGDNPRDPEWL